jgi:hypothetical protein
VKLKAAGGFGGPAHVAGNVTWALLVAPPGAPPFNAVTASV